MTLYFQSIEDFHWLIGVFLAFLLLVVFTFSGIFIVRRVFNTKLLKSHHDIAGFVFANLGVLYAVLIGFTVVNVQTRFDSVKQNLDLESSYLSDLHRDSQVFEDQDKERVREALRNYVDSVLEKEWGRSVDVAKYTPSSEMLEIWKVYYAIDLKTKKQELWYAQSLDKLNLLMNARIFRLMGGEESLTAEMWTILILGGISIMAFTWLFGPDNLWYHLLIVAFLAATTSSLLFLIYSLDTAFSGSVSLPPDAFKHLLQMLQA